MNKKILIIGIIVGLLVVVAIAVTVLKKKKTAPLVIQSGLTKISTEEVLFPTLSSDNKKFIYFSNTKEVAFFQMNIDGSDNQQISDPLDTPQNIIWSDDRKKAILRITYNQYVYEKYGSRFASPGTSDQTLTTWYYDLESKELKKLNDNIGQIIWTPENKIIYQFLKPEENINSLDIANADGSDKTKIIDLPTLEQYNFSYLEPNKSLVLNSSPSDISNSIIYTLELQDNKLTKIKEVKNGTLSKGLANNKILFNLPSNKDFPQIAIMNSDGSAEKKLNVFASLISCKAVDENTLLASNNNLIELINLKTSKVTIIRDISEENLNPSNLIISPDKKTFYFTSNNKLYKLNIN